VRVRRCMCMRACMCVKYESVYVCHATRMCVSVSVCLHGCKRGCECTRMHMLALASVCCGALHRGDVPPPTKRIVFIRAEV
jgi:hypothetical protein